MPEVILSVGKVNAYIKSIFENDFALRQIAVRGEVSNCKYHASGHIYFTLKDETGVLNAVMFRGNAARGLRFRLSDGQQVIVRGSVTVYERDGRYQLYAHEIVSDGIGDLHRRFEETKKRLEEMGMFALEYKQQIPAFVSTVGVVTASTGAAIRDIENVISRRNPNVQIYLCPAIVQGADAADSIIRGIKRLDAMGLDVLIVGRGGGSLEDLMAFNEESVARAIFECETPIITGIGHETDFTIADFVADLRAPTPSAAAEQAVFDSAAFLTDLAGRKARLSRNLTAKLNAEKLRVSQLKNILDKKSPMYVLDEKRNGLMASEELLRSMMREAVKERREYVTDAGTRLRDAESSLLTCIRSSVNDSQKELQSTMRESIAKARVDGKELKERLIRGMKDRKKDAFSGLSLLIAKLEGCSPLRAFADGYSYLTDRDGKNISSVSDAVLGEDVNIRISDGDLKARITEISLQQR